MSKIFKYLIAPYKITVCQNEDFSQKYIVEPALDISKFHLLSYEIEKEILSRKGFLDNEILKLDALIQYLKRIVIERLETLSIDLTSKLSLYLSDWIVYRIIGLEHIMPLLLDDSVQEIFLDKPNNPLYIDHKDYGRCVTNIILTEEELDFFKTRLCLEKDEIINHVNPSLKVELKTDKFHVRVAMDIPPLASDGLSMNIRKLRRKIWTLPELIFCNMLSLEAAAYLLFVMFRRNNITIIGEPGSGKTTLANALDFLTPEKWRKVTIEDVIESIEQTEYKKFQTRFSVSPFEKNIHASSKSDEIIKLLHRSPTWVYLGEIQTAEHSRALFESLCAGLVGIQTCHGRTIEMIIIRWLNQHNIPLTSLFSLDLLVETSIFYEKNKPKRYVSRIAEISKDIFINNKFIDSLTDLKIIEPFKYCFKENKLLNNCDLFNTPSINSIKRKENISREDFLEEFSDICSVLEMHIKNKIFDPPSVLNSFCKLTNKFYAEIKNQ